MGDVYNVLTVHGWCVGLLAIFVGETSNKIFHLTVVGSDNIPYWCPNRTQRILGNYDGQIRRIHSAALPLPHLFNTTRIIQSATIWP